MPVPHSVVINPCRHRASRPQDNRTNCRVKQGGYSDQTVNQQVFHKMTTKDSSPGARHGFKRTASVHILSEQVENSRKAHERVSVPTRTCLHRSGDSQTSVLQNSAVFRGAQKAAARAPGASHPVLGKAAPRPGRSAGRPSPTLTLMCPQGLAKSEPGLVLEDEHHQTAPQWDL